MDSVTNETVLGKDQDETVAPVEMTLEEMASVRISMARQLLIRSVANYREALEFTRLVDRAMPLPFQPPWNYGAEPEQERNAWWHLHYEADSEFYAAESSLADRINNLYDVAAPEANRVGKTSIGEDFIERAVQLDGVIYSLTFDPGEYEVGKNIIATVRADRLIVLD